MAAKYRRWSPYNYAVNNPIMFIDPDGRQVLSGDDAISFGESLVEQAKAYNAANAEKTDDISFFSEAGDDDESSLSSWMQNYIDGNPIYNQFMRDIENYKNNKPGFGDDGGYLTLSNSDLKNVYFNKVVKSFYVKNTLVFNDQNGLSKYVEEMQNANDMINNGLNVALGFASLPGQVLPVVASVSLGMLGPGYISEPWSVEPRLGDKLVGNTTYKLMFSVNGDVNLNVSNYVFQYDSNNKYLGRKSFSKDYELSYQMKDVIRYLLEAKTKINNPINVK